MLITEGADDIKKIEKNQTAQALIFTWEEPSDPNGIILTYNIEIQAENVNFIR